MKLWSLIWKVSYTRYCLYLAFLLFFQRFSLGGDKTTRDVSLDEIGAGEAIWTAMKDANSNCKQIPANLICIKCASSCIIWKVSYTRYCLYLAFLLFFQRFSLGGDKTTRDVSLDEIGAGEAIWTAMKDANSNCKQILANLICIRCASSSIVAVICYVRHNGVTFFFKSHFYFLWIRFHQKFTKNSKNFIYG